MGYEVQVHKAKGCGNLRKIYRVMTGFINALAL